MRGFGVVWECALTGRMRQPLVEILDAVSGWLTGSVADLTVAGRPDGKTAELVQ